MKKILLLVALMVTSFSLANAQISPAPFSIKPGNPGPIYNPTFPDPAFHVDVWENKVAFTFSLPVTKVTVQNLDTGAVFGDLFPSGTTYPQMYFSASNGTWLVTAKYANGMLFNGRFLINRGNNQVGVTWAIDGDPYVTYHFLEP